MSKQNNVLSGAVAIKHACDQKIMEGSELAKIKAYEAKRSDRVR